MAIDIDIAGINQAYAWSNIRGSNLPEALSYALMTINEADKDSDEYRFALGIAASIYEGLGDFENALQFNRMFFKMSLEKVEKEPENPDYWLLLLSACMGVGSVLLKLSMVPEALAHFVYMDQMASKFLGILPDDKNGLKAKAFACEKLASLFLDHETPSKAYPYCIEYEESLLKLLALDPSDIDMRNKVNISVMLFGDYYMKTGQDELALKYYLKAEREARHLSLQYEIYADIRSTYATINERIGSLYIIMGQYDNALIHLKTNEEIVDSLVRKSPDNITLLYNHVTALQCIGNALHSKGDFLEALSYFDKCSDAVARLLQFAPEFEQAKKMVAVIYQYRAMIYDDTGMLDNAKENYLAMYGYLKQLFSLHCEDPQLKAFLAHACCLVSFFWENELRDIEAIMYLEEGLQLYVELALRYPTTPEYEEKAMATADDLADLKLKFEEDR